MCSLFEVENLCVSIHLFIIVNNICSLEKREYRTKFCTDMFVFPYPVMCLVSAIGVKKGGTHKLGTKGTVGAQWEHLI